MTEESKQASPAGQDATPGVAVIIPTHRDMAFVVEALPRLLASNGVAIEAIVVNNDPEQTIGAWVEQLGDARVRVIEVGFNSGFMGAINRGIRATAAPWVFFHNADMTVSAGHLAGLVAFAETEPDAGCVSGKILRLDKRTRQPTRVIDSAGMAARRSRATFDRGEGEIDRGQFDSAEEVFAVSGAGLLARRAALEDIAENGEYLDERLFMYKDDFDLGWRLRLRGWRCFYVPGAPAYHVRSSRALAGRSYLKHPRAYLRAAAKRSNVTRQHSMRNQWLIILKNDRWADVARDAPWILGREALVVCATLVTAPRVALGAIGSFVKLIPTLRSRRRQVRGRATMTGQEIRRWFRS